MNKKAKIIALANQKGGVGKTTTTINLAAALACLDQRVLVVDSDPQGNASSGLGVAGRDMVYHLYHCYLEATPAAQAIRPIAELEQNLHLLPAQIDLVGVEVELMAASQRETMLARILAPLRPAFDYILIDCPPSLGLLTVNALTAADSVIIPMQCEYFALEGLSQLVRTVRLVKKSYNPQLTVEGLVLTMFDRRNNLTFQVAKEIQQHFKDQVYSTVIPRNVRLSESPSHGKPVLLYDRRCAGAVGYLSLGREFLQKQRPAA